MTCRVLVVAVQVLLQDKLLKMAKAEKLPPFPVGGSGMMLLLGQNEGER